ncbi:MAG: hypothetical protein AMXMBFR53_08440 [Gemmatimonadota bacterium]
MSTIKRDARRAGLLYLLLAFVGPFNQLYLPGRYIVSGNAAETAANLVAGATLWRFGAFVGIASNVLFLAVALSLYALLVGVDRKQARLMLALVGVGVAVGAVSAVNQVVPLVLLGKAEYLSAFTQAQREALAMSFLRIQSVGNSIAMAFWGLWLLPFGALVIKSRYFPRIIGILLVVGCFAYLALSFTLIVLPTYAGDVNRVAMPLYAVGEVSMILWLLVKGAREPDAHIAGVG